MGTLTANCPRLDTHCPHKLATSCRLTSTPNCCACADERSHSRLYRVYIDGVGFVQRGTRWQSYCWFCKEFWNNRLASTEPPLEPSQTQIPHIPDQSDFLERWFEFHQGYRVVKQADGSESRIAVLGEPFREVSPGFLPRTLDQLRREIENDEHRPENRFRRRRLSSEEERSEEPQQSIEDALDSLLAEVSEDEAEEDDRTNETGQSHTLELSDTPALETIDTPRPPSMQRTRERFVRIFGTREDVERDDYVSPISNLFTRATHRYRQAEERRAASNTASPVRVGLSIEDRREIEQQVLWGVIENSQPPFNMQAQGEDGASERSVPHRQREDSGTGLHFDESPLDGTAPLNTTTASASAIDITNTLSQLTRDLVQLRQASEAVTNARNALQSRRLPSLPPQTLDQPNRPPPLTDEQMTKNLACHICYSQLADTAVLPCGHMVMCEWCADIAIPVRHSHIPDRPSKCPLCRKSVKQRFKIHLGS